MTNNLDGSFIPPPPGNVGPDVGGLERRVSYETNTEPLDRNQPVVIPLGKLTGNKDYAGCFYWKIRLSEARGGFMQKGTYSKASVARSSGALRCDAPGYLSLPPLTQSVASNPPGTMDRMTSATVFGVHVWIGYENGTGTLMRETSATDPTPIVVAGYTGIIPAGAGGPLCMVQVFIGGIEYLAIGYAGAAANNLQLLANLNNPPTNSFVPVGALPVWGIIQTAIDGNALLVYMSSGVGGSAKIVAIRTDVLAAGTAVSAPRATLAIGGVAVGLSACEGQPMAYLLEPLQAGILGSNTLAATNKARLIRTDPRGYLPSVVDVPLPWVTFASKWRDGMVVCDQSTHWFIEPGYQRKMRRMDFFGDELANSDKQLVCCGHHENAGKFVIEVNETITLNPPANGGANGVGNTVRYWMEWDYDLWAPQIKSSPKTLSTTGVQSIGGSRNPWSPLTGYLHSRADGSWWRMYEPPLGVNFFNQRHTTGAHAGTGRDTETTESITWPPMDIDGLEDCKKVMLGGVGPRSADIAEGGTGAKVVVEELLSGMTITNDRQFTFQGTEPPQRIEKRLRRDRDWTYKIQPKATITRTSTDDLPTKYNLNGFDLWIEGIAVKDELRAPPAALLKALDALKL